MPNIDDLRAAYATLKDRAPTEIGAAPRSVEQPPTEFIRLSSARAARQPRQRVLLPALLAAAVAVIATTVGVAATTHHSSSGVQSAASETATPTTASTPSDASTPTATVASVPVGPALPATGYAFSVGSLPSALQAHGGITGPNLDQMTIDTSDGKLAGIISAAPTGQWHPAIPDDAVPVKIDGHTGYYGTMKFDLASFNDDSWFLDNASFFTGGDSDEPGVVWEEPSGLWLYVTGVTHAATVKQSVTVVTSGSVPTPSPTGADLPLAATGAFAPYGDVTAPGPYRNLPTAALSKDQLVAVANAVHVGSGQAKTPFKLGYVPAGFKADDTTDLSDSALASVNPNHFIGGVTVSVNDGSNPLYNQLYIGLSSGSIAPDVQVAYKYRPFVESPKYTTITIGSYTGKYSPDDPTVVLRNGTVSLTIGVSDGEGKGVPLADLTKIVEGITLASNLADQSTWFSADKAIS